MSLFKVSNGKIIIHGGKKTGSVQVTVTPDIAVLNTETFEWSAPLISSNVGVVPKLARHTVNLVGNYMIAAFGKHPFIFIIIKISFISLIN